MTVSEIKKLLVSADPDVQRYDHENRGSDAYTVWYETGRAEYYGDGAEQNTIRFQVDRFTRTEDDATAAAILAALEGADDIAVEYIVDYERDTGYIHHIFSCEAV